MKLTRRALAKIMGASVVMARPIGAQAPPAPEANLNITRGQFHEAARELAAFKLPRAIEPASRFEA